MKDDRRDVKALLFHMIGTLVDRRSSIAPDATWVRDAELTATDRSGPDYFRHGVTRSTKRVIASITASG